MSNKYAILHLSVPQHRLCSRGANQGVTTSFLLLLQVVHEFRQFICCRCLSKCRARISNIIRTGLFDEVLERRVRFCELAFEHGRSVFSINDLSFS